MMSRVAIGLLLGAVVATAGCDRQTAPAGQANATADAATVDAATADEVSPDEAAPASSAPDKAVGGIDRTHRGEAAPAVAFLDPAGAKTTLAAFRGRPVLLNLWATWCAPCIKELPGLNEAAGAGAVAILAVSQDLDRSKAAPFLAGRGLRALKPYADPDMALSLYYKVNLPTTIMFGADGKERWRVAGAFDWTGAAAKRLLAER